jgi:hypothetical protein
MNKLEEALKKLSDTQNEVCAQVIERAKELGLTEVQVGSKSEYDDNNYYTQHYLERVFDCKNMELGSYDIDEGTKEAIEFIKELTPRNATDFIAGKVKLSEIIKSNEEKIEEFKESFEYSLDVVDIIIELIKNDIPLDRVDECMDFLSALINLEPSCVPSGMQY